jgi:hypothetical protein
MKGDMTLAIAIIRSNPKAIIPELKERLIKDGLWYVKATTTSGSAGTQSSRSSRRTNPNAESTSTSLNSRNLPGATPTSDRPVAAFGAEVSSFTLESGEQVPLENIYILGPQDAWLRQPLLVGERTLEAMGPTKLQIILSKIEPIACSMENQNSVLGRGMKVVPKSRTLEVIEYCSNRPKGFIIKDFKSYLSLIHYLYMLYVGSGSPAKALMLEFLDWGKHGWWQLWFDPVREVMYLIFNKDRENMYEIAAMHKMCAEQYLLEYEYSQGRGRVTKKDGSMLPRLCASYMPSAPKNPLHWEHAALKVTTPLSVPPATAAIAAGSGSDVVTEETTAPGCSNGGEPDAIVGSRRRPPRVSKIAAAARASRLTQTSQSPVAGKAEPIATPSKSQNKTSPTAFSETKRRAGKVDIDPSTYAPTLDKDVPLDTNASAPLGKDLNVGKESGGPQSVPKQHDVEMKDIENDRGPAAGTKRKRFDLIQTSVRTVHAEDKSKESENEEEDDGEDGEDGEEEEEDVDDDDEEEEEEEAEEDAGEDEEEADEDTEEEEEAEEEEEEDEDEDDDDEPSS